MRSVVFVVNGALVRDPRGFGQRCRAAARQNGWDAVLAETSPGDSGLGLARQAVADGAGLVFAAGGDGTVRACAQALAGTGIPLAIVPLGTANLTARALGIPDRADRALRAGFSGRDRRIEADEQIADRPPEGRRDRRLCLRHRKRRRLVLQT
jgi:diacylglycerol kinase (ATP)